MSGSCDPGEIGCVPVLQAFLAAKPALDVSRRGFLRYACVLFGVLVSQSGELRLFLEARSRSDVNSEPTLSREAGQGPSRARSELLQIVPSLSRSPGAAIGSSSRNSRSFLTRTWLDDMMVWMWARGKKGYRDVTTPQTERHLVFFFAGTWVQRASMQKLFPVTSSFHWTAPLGMIVE